MNSQSKTKKPGKSQKDSVQASGTQSPKGGVPVRVKNSKAQQQEGMTPDKRGKKDSVGPSTAEPSTVKDQSSSSKSGPNQTRKNAGNTESKQSGKGVSKEKNNDIKLAEELSKIKHAIEELQKGQQMIETEKKNTQFPDVKTELHLDKIKDIIKQVISENDKENMEKLKNYISREYFDVEITTITDKGKADFSEQMKILTENIKCTDAKNETNNKRLETLILELKQELTDYKKADLPKIINKEIENQQNKAKEQILAENEKMNERLEKIVRELKQELTDYKKADLPKIINKEIENQQNKAKEQILAENEKNNERLEKTVRELKQELTDYKKADLPKIINKEIENQQNKAKEQILAETKRIVKEEATSTASRFEKAMEQQKTNDKHISELTDELRKLNEELNATNVSTTLIKKEIKSLTSKSKRVDEKIGLLDQNKEHQAIDEKIRKHFEDLTENETYQQVIDTMKKQFESLEEVSKKIDSRIKAFEKKIKSMHHDQTTNYDNSMEIFKKASMDQQEVVRDLRADFDRFKVESASNDVSEIVEKLVEKSREQILIDTKEQTDQLIQCELSGINSQLEKLSSSITQLEKRVDSVNLKEVEHQLGSFHTKVKQLEENETQLQQDSIKTTKEIFSRVNKELESFKNVEIPKSMKESEKNFFSEVTKRVTVSANKQLEDQTKKINQLVSNSSTFQNSHEKKMKVQADQLNKNSNAIKLAQEELKVNKKKHEQQIFRMCETFFSERSLKLTNCKNDIPVVFKNEFLSYQFKLNNFERDFKLITQTLAQKVTDAETKVDDLISDLEDAKNQNKSNAPDVTDHKNDNICELELKEAVKKISKLEKEISEISAALKGFGTKTKKFNTITESTKNESKQTYNKLDEIRKTTDDLHLKIELIEASKLKFEKNTQIELQKHDIELQNFKNNCDKIEKRFIPVNSIQEEANKIFTNKFEQNCETTATLQKENQANFTKLTNDTNSLIAELKSTKAKLGTTMMKVETELEKLLQERVTVVSQYGKLQKDKNITTDLDMINAANTELANRLHFIEINVNKISPMVDILVSNAVVAGNNLTSPSKEDNNSANGSNTNGGSTGELNAAGNNNGLDASARKDPGEIKARLPALGIATEEEIRGMPVATIRKLLRDNSVNFDGCFEKGDLVSKLTRLWKDLNKHADAVPEADRCLICMDSRIDCVFLECGHTATCHECGLKIKDCPVCRTYIVRVVRTYRP